MARLIDSTAVVETDHIIAGLPVVEFIEELPAPNEVLTTPRKAGGARLDRAFEVIEWFDC